MSPFIQTRPSLASSTPSTAPGLAERETCQKRKSRHHSIIMTGWMVVVLLAASGAGRVQAATERETFCVQAFTNERHAAALGYLESGLPAFVAERLGRHAPLHFAGGSALLPRGKGDGEARWVVEGSFSRQSTGELQVRVVVHGRGPAESGEVSSEAVRTGGKDGAPALALEATLAAFAALPGISVPALPAALAAPFSHDPYAFVLYGRGLGAALKRERRAADVERALQLLKRSLVIDPKVPETRRYLGFLELEAGRPGHARAVFASALDLRPDYAPVLSALAALDRAAGLPIARERYGKVVELDPEDAEARRAYGELLFEAGQLDDAHRELARVVNGTPGDLRARRSLALVLAARQAGPELVADLEELVKLDGEDLDARMDLAAAYASVGRVSDAEAVYEEVLRRRPRHLAALKLAGDLARGRGDVKRAAVLYGKLRGVAPQDPRPVFLLGAAQYEAGNLDAAERMFEEGGRFPGMQGEAYSNLGAIALRRGQPKEALSLLARASKRRPGKATVRYNYAMALFAAGHHADALNELRVAASLDPGDAGVQFFAGVVALRLGLLRDAEQAFRAALRLDPRNEDARHNLALLEPLVNPHREGTLSLGDPVPGAIQVRTTDQE
jgi:Flp pilus assembly protein TadD